MADDVVTDLEIAVLCDLLDGPGVNLKAHIKGAFLMRLFSRDLSGRQKTTLKDFDLLTKHTTFWPNGAWE